jgi:hypothetical protein
MRHADRCGPFLCSGFHLHHRFTAGDQRRGHGGDPTSENLAVGAQTPAGRRPTGQGGAGCGGATAVMRSNTHIVPVAVGDPAKCKAASDLLLSEHGIYIQPINYPTVAKDTERLRIMPIPCHEDIMIDQLAAGLIDVWNQLGNNLEYAAE